MAKPSLPVFRVLTEQDETELFEGQSARFRTIIVGADERMTPTAGDYEISLQIDGLEKPPTVHRTFTLKVEEGGVNNTREVTLCFDNKREQKDRLVFHVGPAEFDTSNVAEVQVIVTATHGKNPPSSDETTTRFLIRSDDSSEELPVRDVRLTRTRVPADDQAFLWPAIEYSAESLSYPEYERILSLLLCRESANARRESQAQDEYDRLLPIRFTAFNNLDAYRVLKVATEAFVVVNSLVPVQFQDAGAAMLDPADVEQLRERAELTEGRRQIFRKFRDAVRRAMNGTSDPILPFLALLHRNLGSLDLVPSDREAREHQACYEVLREKLVKPCFLELIWSYWHEEAMQVQTMLAIRDRFQNVRRADNDPLAHMEIASLRPLNNYLWGYIQDEQHRLTMARRAYEYDHHYGFTLHGKAVPSLRPADSRSKFLEAFNHLLTQTCLFFKEDADATKVSDAFPVLNAIKEVHYLLAEGMHNQFGDLPSTARQEMLIEQWLLARPEMQQFLPRREMMPYPEGWMGAVDSMKAIQGWTDTSAIYFHDLATFGEMILLSVRFGHWSAITDPASAKIWARYWRPKIQGYVHAYRTVTGVDLSTEAKDTQERNERHLPPSVHLLRRLQEQRRIRPGLPAGGRLPTSPTARTPRLGSIR